MRFLINLRMLEYAIRKAYSLYWCFDIEQKVIYLVIWTRLFCNKNSKFIFGKNS